MAFFTVQRKINLPLQEVWQLIGDFTASPGPEVKVEVEKRGDPENHGVGTIRNITIGNVCVKEILDSATPPTSFRYRILSGAPMKEYHGTVHLEESGHSTTINWQADIKPKIPFTGPILVKVAKGAVNGFLDSVEKNHT